MPSLFGTSLRYADGAIVDSEGRFISEGFNAGDLIATYGSTTPSNDVRGVPVIYITAAGLTVPTDTFTGEQFEEGTQVIKVGSAYNFQAAGEEWFPTSGEVTEFGYSPSQQPGLVSIVNEVQTSFYGDSSGDSVSVQLSDSNPDVTVTLKDSEGNTLAVYHNYTSGTQINYNYQFYPSGGYDLTGIFDSSCLPENSGGPYGVDINGFGIPIGRWKDHSKVCAQGYNGTAYFCDTQWEDYATYPTSRMHDRVHSYTSSGGLTTLGVPDSSATHRTFVTVLAECPYTGDLWGVVYNKDTTSNKLFKSTGGTGAVQVVGSTLAESSIALTIWFEANGDPVVGFDGDTAIVYDKTAGTVVATTLNTRSWSRHSVAYGNLTGQSSATVNPVTEGTNKFWGLPYEPTGKTASAGCFLCWWDDTAHDWRYTHNTILNLTYWGSTSTSPYSEMPGMHIWILEGKVCSWRYDSFTMHVFDLSVSWDVTSGGSFTSWRPQTPALSISGVDVAVYNDKVYQIGRFSEDADSNSCWGIVELLGPYGGSKNYTPLTDASQSPGTLYGGGATSQPSIASGFEDSYNGSVIALSDGFVVTAWRYDPSFGGCPVTAFIPQESDNPIRLETIEVSGVDTGYVEGITGPSGPAAPHHTHHSNTADNIDLVVTGVVLEMIPKLRTRLRFRGNGWDQPAWSNVRLPLTGMGGLYDPSTGLTGIISTSTDLEMDQIIMSARGDVI